MSMLPLLITLCIGALLAWLLERVKQNSAKWVALCTLLLASVYFLMISINVDFSQGALTITDKYAWISSANIYFLLAVDQLSLTLISLTLVLAFVAIMISWFEVNTKVGFYYFNLLLAIAGTVGVFIAVDLFLFFFFWEVMLLPITALIAIWGHEGRHFAAIKFFIFTQLSSLCMLIAIVTMAILHQSYLGYVSWSWFEWQQVPISNDWQFIIMLGFFIAFAVKLPSIPLHSWLPDAHTQAPTAGSVLLAGILLKTGAYGMIRFVIQLFPEAAASFDQIALTLGAFSVLYGAKLAFAQQDFKRLVAYSSISHMGFVMMALFAFDVNAYQGAIMTMVAHGLSSAALFCLAGMIYQRIHSRQLSDMGGFWDSAPFLAGFSIMLVAAATGVPGFANFIGEFYSLVGVFKQYPIHASVAALAIIGSAVYGMRLFQSAFHGPKTYSIPDMSKREWLILSPLILLLILLGLSPNLLLNLGFVGGA